MCCIDTWQITTSSAGNENLLHNNSSHVKTKNWAIMKIYIFYIKVCPKNHRNYKTHSKREILTGTYAAKRIQVRKRKSWSKFIWMVPFCSLANGILRHTSEASLPRKRPRCSEWHPTTLNTGKHREPTEITENKRKVLENSQKYTGNTLKLQRKYTYRH